MDEAHSDRRKKEKKEGGKMKVIFRVSHSLNNNWMSSVSRSYANHQHGYKNGLDLGIPSLVEEMDILLKNTLRMWWVYDRGI